MIVNPYNNTHQENAELKLHLGQLEFKFRKSSSQSIRDSNSQDVSSSYFI